MMRKSERSDDGLSLIELVVVVLLLGILASAVGLIFANSWRAQNDVTTTTQATNRGQLIGQSIERAMRNAQAFNVSPDGTVLRVHTNLGGSKSCQGFWFTGGGAYMTMRSSAIPATTSTTLWPGVWQTGVMQDGANDFFTQSSQSVAYDFTITTAAAPVQISGESAMRTPTTGVTSPCW